MTEIDLPVGGVLQPGPNIFTPDELSGKCSSLRNFEPNAKSIVQSKGCAAVAGFTAIGDVLGIVPYLDSIQRPCLMYAVKQGASRVDIYYWNIQLGSGGAVYTSVSTTTSLRIPMAVFRDRVFIGTNDNGLHWVNINGLTPGPYGKAGVTPPASAPTLATGSAGNLTGTYSYKVTYVNSLGHESNPSAASSDITVSADQINLSSIPTSGGQARKLYRTVANGSAWFELATLNGTDTTYTDNAYDTALGDEVSTTNTVPPTNVRAPIPHKGRLYLLDGSDGLTLYACKADAITGDPNIDAYPTEYSTKLPTHGGGDQAYAGISRGDTLIIASLYKMYAVTGDPSQGQSIDKIFDDGVFANYAFTQIPGGTVFFSGKRKLYAWPDDGSPEEIGQDVAYWLNLARQPSGVSYPHPVYDSLNNRLLLFFAMNQATNDLAVSMDMDTKKWALRDLSFDICVCADPNPASLAAERLFGVTTGSVTLKQIGGYQFDSSYFSTSEIVTHFFYPGEDMYVYRLGIEGRALPTSSSVPPLLFVKAALDGSGSYLPTKVVDFSRNPLYQGAGSERFAGHGVTRVYYPIHRVCRSIRINLYPPKNAAGIQGYEFYRFFLEVDQRANQSDARRNLYKDQKVGE